MTETIKQATFMSALFYLLEETFETHHGIYLDDRTSLSDTLAGITAEEASRPVGGKCASLAAQVTHVIFYMDVLGKYMRGEPVGKLDWGEIWRTVEKVTAEEWDELRQQLMGKYRSMSAEWHSLATWDNEDALSGALAVVVHTAYHLGEIRQALCILR
jgi:hypothetical protein